VPIDLTQFERGDPFTGDYYVELAALQGRLAALQTAQIVHRKRALVIFEGWVGSGKKAALKRLVGAWDPCHVATRCAASRDGEGDDRHWLAPFWSSLPPAGDTTIFFRSWYRRIVFERVMGRIDDKRWARACDEINEFESQQRDHGTLVVKLFFHVTPQEQARRINERAADPWQRHLLSPENLASTEYRGRTQEAVTDMFAQTDTRWAPWRIIDANDERAGRLAALRTLADAFAKAIPADPPEENGDVVPIRQHRSA
jgi:AMP-polyphosphate phosphotransferase